MGSMYLEREDKIGETNEETNTAGLGLGWDHFGNTAWVGLVLDWFNSWVGVAWTGTGSGLILQLCWTGTWSGLVLQLGGPGWDKDLVWTGFTACETKLPLCSTHTGPSHCVARCSLMKKEQGHGRKKQKTG